MSGFDRTTERRSCQTADGSDARTADAGSESHANHLDDGGLAAEFSAALRDRVGSDRFAMWFAPNVTYRCDLTQDGNSQIQLMVSGQFALDRIRNNFSREIRAAAASIDPRVSTQLSVSLPQQKALPLELTPDTQRQSAIASTPAGLESGGIVQGGETFEAHSNTHSVSTDRSSNISRALSDPGRSASQSYPPSQNPFSAGQRSSRRGGPSKIGGLAGDSTRGAIDRRRHFQSKAPTMGSGPASGSQSNSPGERDERTRTATNGRGQVAGSPSAGHATTGDATAGHATAGQPSAGPPINGPRSDARGEMTMDNFIVGPSSSLAHTAATMVCQNPQIPTVVYLSGPSGVGKTHLLTAIADVLRRRHRMRWVMQLSAEQFTNEFVAVVGKGGITNFRSRYRGVDALLVDEVHFLAKKKATIREFVHTIGALSAAGKTLIFAGTTTPHDTDGITAELAGRMTSGLVCPMLEIDSESRRRLLMRYVETRCPLAIDGDALDHLVPLLPGDGRMISGVANAIHLMQRMYGRTPNWMEIRQQCGHLLRGVAGEINLQSIEDAVCDLFGLESKALRSGSQARVISQPRMLAMYLSRQKTSSAYTEIAKHYNVRSHSTAIAAEKNVRSWIEEQRMIGRGSAAVPAAEAITKVETMLRGERRRA